MCEKNRTLEELKKDNFKNLTYGELCKNRLDCKNYCPLYQKICSGGIACYGGEPLEPPCCGFDEDDVLQEKLNEFIEMENYWDKREEEEILKKKEKEEKSRIRKQKYKEYKLRNWNDLYDIRILNQKIKNLKKQFNALSKLTNFALAVNMTNKMLKECVFDCPNDKSIEEPSQLQKDIQDKILQYEKEIEKIKLNIKIKEKKRKYE